MSSTEIGWFEGWSGKLMDSGIDTLGVLCRICFIGEMSVHQLEFLGQKGRNNNILKVKKVDNHIC